MGSWPLLFVAGWSVFGLRPLRFFGVVWGPRCGVWRSAISSGLGLGPFLVGSVVLFGDVVLLHPGGALLRGPLPARLALAFRVRHPCVLDVASVLPCTLLASGPFAILAQSGVTAFGVPLLSSPGGRFRASTLAVFFGVIWGPPFGFWRAAISSGLGKGPLPCRHFRLAGGRCVAASWGCIACLVPTRCRLYCP